MRFVAAFVCATAAAIALPALAAARTQVVWAGGDPGFQNSMGKLYSAEALAFFPSTTTIHVGDTISWHGMSINFHTIDLPGPAGKDLPLITSTGSLAGNVLDAAGSPFWFDRIRPVTGFNPLLLAASGGHRYDASARVDSGLPLGKPAPFKVTFTKPGVYEYFCDVHFGMHGFIVVRANGTKVPSGAALQATVMTQEAKDLAVAKALEKTKVAKNHLWLGSAGKYRVEILGFFPATLHVKAGTTVTFRMGPGSGEVHTASFGPKAYLTPLANSFLTPVFDPRAVYPSSPPPAGPIVVTPASHGNGFANSGGLTNDASTGAPSSVQFKFTTKGTYHFQCLIHTFMHGTIVVG
jgi:plastocyanin